MLTGFFERRTRKATRKVLVKFASRRHEIEDGVFRLRTTDYRPLAGEGETTGPLTTDDTPASMQQAGDGRCRQI
jgi:hypothetical protein